MPKHNRNKKHENWSSLGSMPLRNLGLTVEEETLHLGKREGCNVVKWYILNTYKYKYM